MSCVEVGEWIYYRGTGGPHSGTVVDVEWSGSRIRNGSTGERIPGVLVTIHCEQCDPAHPFTTPATPAWPWARGSKR